LVSPAVDAALVARFLALFVSLLGSLE
jgi:hypothetical protein